MTFREFGLDEGLIEGIDATGYQTATAVQEQVIPHILAGKDIIASAQTGTGKTAAFLLPIVHKIITSPNHDHINALIIVPTRELAIQIAENLEGLSYFTPISSIAVYGGSSGGSFVQERKALTGGADIVICTPGRFIGHLAMGYVKLKELDYLVLDEADRMLDMGFTDDIQRIISYLPATRQTLLFSATMPPKIRDLARKILKNPIEVNISLSKPPEKITQEAFVVYDTQKPGLIRYILKQKEFKTVIVFCSKKNNVKLLARDLQRSKFMAEEIHSDLEQSEREKVLAAFMNGRVRILVTTDILSRGIHIDNIDLVINYDVPNDGEDYVHRIGRTARAESEGTAYTLINEKEQRKFAAIEKLLGHEVKKAAVPAELGETPAYQPTSFTHAKGRKFDKRKPQRTNGGGPRQAQQ